jgi:uncharacterized protein YndB with AHSA1/START domain
MSEPFTRHATFAIERKYDYAPSLVFRAFADPAAKRRWFAEGDGWQIETFDASFEVGGHERSRFRFNGGPLIRNDTVYHDIVADRRIVIAYTMVVADVRISASLATIEFKPEGAGTRLVYTEQAAFLDGRDQAADRKQGCEGLLEAIDAELRRTVAAA